MQNILPLALDIGLNNGDDSEYYIRKGFRVIGIDANPKMCEVCKDRFRTEIRTGQMTILNIGVSEHPSNRRFSMNVQKPAISTFEPHRFENEEWAPKEWEYIDIELKTVSSLIGIYGMPQLIKIDVEFYDHLVVNDLRANGIMPKYITAEAQDQKTFDGLVAMGYRLFRVMPGSTVNDRFGAAQITRLDGVRIPHSFPIDSSGPFGDDFPDPWLDAEGALAQLLDHGLGWIDIHATR